MIKKGVVSTIDILENKISVAFKEFDSTVSSKLPLLSGQNINSFNINDVVIVVFINGSMTDGVVLGKVGV